MPTPIRIITETCSIPAELNDCETSRQIAELLPIKANGNRWGGELYFSLPVEADLEEGASQVVVPGTLAFWPPGCAFCLFWGKTPASQDNECRAASQVSIVGMMSGPLDGLEAIKDGETIIIERT